MGNREFSRYEHKDTITSSDTKVSNTFLEDMKAYIAQYNNEEELKKEGAIDFAKWIGGSYSFGNIAGKWYSHENTDKEYTEEQLYELYLKEINE